MNAHDDTGLGHGEGGGSRGEYDAHRRRSRARSSKRTSLPLWQETLILLVTALVLAVVVKTFFVQAFYIPSGSMEPTLEINDRILVEKVSYWSGDIERGDVVVFDDPGGWLDPTQSEQPHNAVQRALEIFGLFPTGGHLVKRVIGVGGDRITCCDQEGRLRVNGTALSEPYLEDPKASPEDFEVRVPPGHLWVMGDNRANSADSRAHMGEPGGGFLPVEDVLGRAWVVVWPWERVGTIDDPATFDSLASSGPRADAPHAATRYGARGVPGSTMSPSVFETTPR